MDIDIEAGQSSIPGAVPEFGTDNFDTSESSSIPEELGIEDLQELIDQTPREDLELPRYQQILGVALIIRYQNEGNLTDLQIAVKNLQEAVGLTPEGNPERAGRLQSLARAFGNRYRRFGDLKDLEAAMLADQEAVQLTPEAHLERPGRLQSLAQRLGNLSDLEAALQADQEAVRLTPEGHPESAEHLLGLATSFGNRYRRLGDLSDLEAALQADQEAVQLTPKGHPDRADRLRGLATSFGTRYQRLGDRGDLEAALQTNQEAVGLTPEGHPERPDCLQNLAVLGDPSDLEAALQADQEAVGLTPEGHSERADRLKSLAGSLTYRYRRLGDLSDLDGALQADQEAVGLTTEGHPDRAADLQNLAVSFGDRYQRLGDLSDLEAALHMNQEAVRLTPEGHPERPGRLRGLSVSFAERYQRLGDMSDLEAALQADQEAVGLTPEGHPERPSHLQNLAVSFKARYQRLGDLSDLEAALQADQEAIGLTPEGHPDRAGCLQNLATSFSNRYTRLGNLSDLKTALQANEEAVQLTPGGHPDRAGRLQNLAASFRNRYQRLGNLSDLEAALQANEEAVGLTPEGHPGRPARLQNLAVFFADSSAPQKCWIAALRWASVSQGFHSAHELTAYSNAFRLLPDILWVGNLLTIRHGATHQLGIGQATSSAARAFIAHSQYSSAVEIIEQAVGITFQQMLQLKTDMHGLPSSQAQKLQLLSAELYSGTSSNPQDVANQRQKILDDIRQGPGLEHFLLPQPYKALSRASQGGPVVILNSHKNCCDGIMILTPASDPVHFFLPNVTLAMLKSQQETLRQLLIRSNVRTREESASTRLFGRYLLAWLYINVVAPVYQVLESHSIHNGRLWWLPTGAFTGLPLHACSPTNEFIHSYTATLGSLLNAYSKRSSNPPKVGVVGVTHTSSGVNHLPGVEQEVKKIMSIIKGSPVKCLQGPQATPDAVKLQLQDCSWVHLACHGTQDLREPTKSRLLLYQGTLELETILRMDLSTAEFVFLAACQTAMGDSQLVNESFHLGGGFIAAGFRSAIGTLWSMNDRDGPLVAEKVYSHLFWEGRQPQASDTAEALQLAVEELKAQKVPYERWIPFTHMGI
ncbi:CHAT domain-containing protein [Mycena vulgaris]|nr:CHAT domain-containing protein [Mycena vulgaris]